MNQIETIHSRLTDFISAMNQWEIENKLNHELETATEEEFYKSREPIREKLLQIFATYCTEKKRKHSRVQALNCSTPPSYAVETQPILKTEKITDKKYLVYTQQLDGFKKQFRYTMVFKKNNWWIDKKEVFRKSEKKWERTDL